MSGFPRATVYLYNATAAPVFREVVSVADKAQTAEPRSVRCARRIIAQAEKRLYETIFGFEYSRRFLSIPS